MKKKKKESACYVNISLRLKFPPGDRFPFNFGWPKLQAISLQWQISAYKTVTVQSANLQLHKSAVPLGTGYFQSSERPRGHF